eukprot:2304557-Amphidinium_carterae.1
MQGHVLILASNFRKGTFQTWATNHSSPFLQTHSPTIRTGLVSRRVRAAIPHLHRDPQHTRSHASRRCIGDVGVTRANHGKAGQHASHKDLARALGAAQGSQYVAVFATATPVPRLSA